MFTQIFSVGSQVEAVIHFDDDTEELQQWDQQVSNTEAFYVMEIGKAMHADKFALTCSCSTESSRLSP